MKIQIAEIQIKAGRREVSADHVRELADSIQELGLLKNSLAKLHHHIASQQAKQAPSEGAQNKSERISYAVQSKTRNFHLPSS